MLENVLSDFMSEYRPGTKEDFDKTLSNVEILEILMVEQLQQFDENNLVQLLKDNGYSYITTEGVMMWLLKEY